MFLEFIRCNSNDILPRVIQYKFTFQRNHTLRSFEIMQFQYTNELIDMNRLFNFVFSKMEFNDLTLIIAKKHVNCLFITNRIFVVL